MFCSERTVFGLILVAVGLTAAWSTAAAEPPAKQRGQRWAVLVGVNDYVSIHKLSYCGQDIVDLRDRLEAVGFPRDQIVVLHDKAPETRHLPFKTNIEQQLKLITRLAKPEDFVIVAFSGHGVYRDGVGYLCPVDARLADPEGSMIGVEWVYEQMKQCPAALKLVLLDACRDDPPEVGEKKSASETANDRRRLTQVLEKIPQGTVLLQSCSEGECSMSDQSLGHSVFMHYVLEGLAGKADENQDSYVTLQELAEFAETNTSKYVYQKFNDLQRPTIRSDLRLQAMRFSLARASLPERTPTAEPMPTPIPAALPEPHTLAVPVTVTQVNSMLVWCPPGKFLMGEGSTKKQVTLTQGFYLGQYEVTQREWKQVMSSEPWKDKSNVKGGDDRPATYVSWEEAMDFCKRLTESEREAGMLKAGYEYALPTEAQWEYACRAGTATAFSFGDDETKLGEFAWFTENTENYEPYAQRVGKKKANPWGLYDMHGNTSEWCRDSLGPPELPGGVDPLSVSGSLRAIRGGGWSDDSVGCQSAHRRRGEPVLRISSLGFRVALVPSSK